MAFNVEPPLRGLESDKLISWLYRLWKLFKGLYTAVYSPTAGQVVGSSESGTAGAITLAGGDGIKVSIKKSTITISLDDTTVTQLEDMIVLLRSLIAEVAVSNELIAANSNGGDTIEDLRQDQIDRLDHEGDG